MAYTREQIWTVADELHASGEKVTYASVQRALGGGSYSTLGGPIRERKEHERIKHFAPSEPLPQSLADQLSRHRTRSTPKSDNRPEMSWLRSART